MANLVLPLTPRLVERVGRRAGGQVSNLPADSGPATADRRSAVLLGDCAWPDFDGDEVLLIPLGSCEQHGPHLPLDTDSRIAIAVATMAVRRHTKAVVAPALHFGASWEHHGFAGLLSLNAEVLTSVLVELGHSADWASGIVFVNGHGGNVLAVERAVAVLVDEGRNVRCWSPSYTNADGSADFHAGVSETSMMLAIEPALVRSELAATGWTGSIDVLRCRPVIDLSPNGVLGDPIGASAEAGDVLLTALADDLSQLITSLLAEVDRRRQLG